MLVSRVKDIELPNRKNVILNERELEFIRANWLNISREYMLDELNAGRVRKISRQRLYRVAYDLGLHKGKWKVSPGYNSFPKDKFTLADKSLIRKLYNKGTDIDTILSIVNMKKDLKISQEEAQAFIDKWQYNIGKTKCTRAINSKEYEYLMENRGIKSYNQMLDELNQRRKVKLSYNQIVYVFQKSNLNDFGYGVIKFSRNEIEYIRRNYKIKSAAEICHFLNRKRKRKMCKTCVTRKIAKMRLRRVWKLTYTEVEIQYIKDNYQRYSGRELASVMNEMREDKRISQTTIRGLLRKLGLKRILTPDDMSQFKKGEKKYKRKKLV